MNIRAQINVVCYWRVIFSEVVYNLYKVLFCVEFIFELCLVVTVNKMD